MANVILNDVEEIMEERGITAEDIQAAVESGVCIENEETGTILARHRIGKVCVYVEYRKDADDCVVVDTYSHRVVLGCEAEE